MGVIRFGMTDKQRTIKEDLSNKIEELIELVCVMEL